MVTNAVRGAWAWGAIAAGLLLAAGCRSPAPGTPAKPEAGTQVAPVTPAAGPPPLQATRTTWPIDPERTVVTIIVRRAGPLARLGHDHVITSADERGSVTLGPTPADSVFELQLPVESFDVDRPDARAAAGPEFAAPVPDEARAGTRRNMLRPEVLDAAGHPLITLRSVAAQGDWSQPRVRLAIEIRGATHEIEVPVLVERDADSLVARGEARFNQSDFGITPFSVAGGAIQVADGLEVRFEIAAHAP